MKPLALLLFFLMLTGLLFGQPSSDYRFFRPNVQYIYENPTVTDNNKDYISPLLGMLGDYKAGGDTMARAYESVAQPIPDFIPEGCFEREPSFAGTSFTEAGGQTVLTFSDSTSLLILRTAITGDTWTAAPGVTGRIISIAENTFLGLTDSVKTIRFTTDTVGVPINVDIEVSRTYGLVVGTYFHDLTHRGIPLPLVGLSSPEVGVQNPSAADVANIPAGTRMAIQRLRSDSRQNGDYFDIYIQQDITTTGQYFDSARQRFVVPYIMNQLTYLNDPTGVRPNFDSLLETGLRDTFSIPFNSTLFNHEGRITQPGQLVPSIHGTHLLAPVLLVEDETGFGKFQGELLESWSTPGCYITSQERSTTGRFYAGVGGPYRTESMFQRNGNDVLGVMNDESSFGTFFDFSDVIINGVNDFHPDNRIRLYPNPTSDRITLEIPADLGRASLRIYGADGGLLRTTAAVTGNRSVSIERLTPGIYTVMVVNESGWVGRRRVIVR